AGGLPTIQSSLSGLVLHRTTGDTTVLYGLNPLGELIEYRGSPMGWTAQNISTITRGGPLQPGLVAWGEVYRSKSERVFVFGTTADGHAVQYLLRGRRWSRIDLSSAPGNPTLAAESLVILPPAAPGGTPSLFGLDMHGSLWRYAGSLYF